MAMRSSREFGDLLAQRTYDEMLPWERWMFNYLRRKDGLPPLRPS